MGIQRLLGNKLGGDIIENKKTFLYLKTLEVADKETRKKLKYYYRKKLKENNFKITEVTRIFQIHNIPFLVSEEIKSYTKKAFDTLDKMNISKDNKENSKSFGTWLMNRTV